MPAFTNLPVELQLELLRHMDMDTLAVMARANKRISPIATDLLWGDIDFVALRDDQGVTHDALLYAQGKFFQVCDRLMDSDDPSRWHALASRVRSLKMVKVPSYAVPRNGEPDEAFQWSFLLDAPDDGRSIYHVIACFHRIETLHFYIRESLDLGCFGEPDAAILEGRLTNLRTVEVGGNISAEMISAILSNPQKLQRLSLINLQDGSAGQEYHSRPVIFLERVASKFDSLARLHLSMLAECTEADDDERPLPWEWDLTDDQKVFAEWGCALRNTCATLEELTLEACYLSPGISSHLDHEVPVDFNELNFENGADATEATDFHGVSSSRRFCDAMLPLIANLHWPRLKKLTFVGVHVGPRALMEAGVLDKLGDPETEIRVLPGSRARFEYDVTPLSISPPNGTFQDDTVVDRLSKLAHVIDRAFA